MESLNLQISQKLVSGGAFCWSKLVENAETSHSGQQDSGI